MPVFFAEHLQWSHYFALNNLPYSWINESSYSQVINPIAWSTSLQHVQPCDKMCMFTLTCASWAGIRWALWMWRWAPDNWTSQRRRTCWSGLWVGTLLLSINGKEKSLISACLKKKLKSSFSPLWYLGQKFPKSREVTMEGKISFSGSTPGPTDPLCTELTAYIKVS